MDRRIQSLQNAAQPEIIKFIEQFRSCSGSDESTIRLFSAGYCWYFAHMLDLAFPAKGQVCLVYPYGHFVFIDRMGVPYDIRGVYTGDCEYFVPDHYIGDAVDSFKHVKDNCPDRIKEVQNIITALCTIHKDKYDFWWLNLPPHMRNKLRDVFPVAYMWCIQEIFDGVRPMIDSFISIHQKNWGKLNDTQTFVRDNRDRAAYGFS
ncbi:MAG: hypothetical protein NC548_11340 [Lachnospiraceae bacterium]|nr:hypothetical protein [Lachnospiraceae bacterium]